MEDTLCSVQNVSVYVLGLGNTFEFSDSVLSLKINCSGSRRVRNLKGETEQVSHSDFRGSSSKVPISRDITAMKLRAESSNK